MSWEGGMMSLHRSIAQPLPAPEDFASSGSLPDQSDIVVSLSPSSGPAEQVHPAMG
jgi:hypothetical protein